MRKAPVYSTGAFLIGIIATNLSAEEFQDTHGKGEDAQNRRTVGNGNEIGKAKNNHEDGKEQITQIFGDFHWINLLWIVGLHAITP
jgi:hypothetical protein